MHIVTNQTREIAREAVRARRSKRDQEAAAAADRSRDLTIDELTTLDLATVRSRDTWRR